MAAEEQQQVQVGFDFIDRRVMAAVERVASSDPNPADPFRGLYISDDRALELTRGDSVSDADDRLAHVTRALGLDLLDAAVLAICAAPELNPRYGRLYAYLQDDVTRKLPSPRLVGHLLSGDGVSAADVMLAFEQLADEPRARELAGDVVLQVGVQAPVARVELRRRAHREHRGLEQVQPELGDDVVQPRVGVRDAVALGEPERDLVGDVQAPERIAGIGVGAGDPLDRRHHAAVDEAEGNLSH